MRTLLINNESTLIDRLIDLIPGEVMVRKWSDLADVSLDDYRLVVLSGSSQFGVLEKSAEMTAEQKIVIEADVPIIGICWGAEFIAYVLGAELEEMPESEHGLVSVQVTADSDLFSGHKSFQVYENHRWKITKLPNKLTELARTEKSLAVFRHQDRPIWGLQFHPESSFPDQTYGDEIFINLFHKILEKVD